ncbi:MAG TPA: hypothetical protein DIW64_10750, partial [Cellvibrio sp.]|nr:hypothetical protein [Cellvibrio sp.]
MVAAFGFRGGAFHWKRVPFALIGWHGLVLLSGKVSVFEEYSLAVGLTLLWGLPAVTIVGYWGEPFNKERFGRGHIGKELLALNHDSITRLKSIGFVLLALSLAFPRVPMTVIQSSEMVLKGLFYIVLVGGLAWWVLYTAKPKAIKENIDYLGNEAAIDASKSVANAGPSGVLAGEISGHALRVPIEDRAVVIGPPGTGKTAFLVSQLLDWAQSGRSFVCMDIKPEIYGIVKKELTAKGYTLYTYNPTQRAGQRYNLFDDVNGPEQIGELASAL